MKHFGDITKISGYTAPIVDCIIGGSPCQDLSVAGKRAGLDGERSGLYMEQIRIVKEMRERERLNGRSGVDIRPRYMVWENVPGAFSSNKGEDFRIVLEELAKVKDENAVIPMPDKGKWTNSGCIMGDGWSIAWRVLDAQFWGVPQRRRRIALVADFGGESAPEILFVRKSVSGHSDESEPKRQKAPTDASGGIGTDDRECYCFEPGAAKRLGGYVWEGLAPTLRTEVGDNRPSVAYTLKIRSGCEGGGKGALVQEDRSATLATNNDQYLFQPVVAFFPQQAYDKFIEDDTATILKAAGGTYGGGSENLVVCIDQGGGKSACNVTEGQAPTLTCTHGGEPAVCYGINGYIAAVAVDCRNGTEGVVNGALQSGAFRSLNCNNVVRQRYIVRRLTPLECERLQGYPDNWTRIGEVVGYERQIDEGTGEEFVQAIYEYIDANGKKRKTSDAARYKALGNSIALPPWKWVLKRLCACYERDATMASLFDGIGGFPLIWEQLNGKGSCLWASEIEEFPIAVTKVRIGD